ncbi:hypothetical protein CEXT_564581 [Caerostris extrusa]|uniref:Uncharacterized protein n=1 Tax=Caerostris extrusa TaxID=172846 RepID=A0AAV4R7L5_CAEEX|nr:hypothetical protein CEXT_564581 [Caerostris extrusa]
MEVLPSICAAALKGDVSFSASRAYRMNLAQEKNYSTTRRIKTSHETGKVNLRPSEKDSSGTRSHFRNFEIIQKNGDYHNTKHLRRKFEYFGPRHTTSLKAHPDTVLAFPAHCLWEWRPYKIHFRNPPLFFQRNSAATLMNMLPPQELVNY